MWVGRAGGRLRFGGLSHTTVLPLSARPSGLVFSGLALGPASFWLSRLRARRCGSLFSTGRRGSPLLARLLQS